MKKLMWFILVVFIIGFALTRNYGTENSTSDNKGSDNKSALAEIRKEKKVLEALITEANVLYVSVVDDGTKRDGFASYLCGILREHHSSVYRVKVVKVNSTNDPNRDNAYGVLLGESWCKR